MSEPKLWSWATALFGDVPGIAYFKAARIDEPFGFVHVLFRNGYTASVDVNHGHATPGRYELRVAAPNGEPARPVGLDDDAVVDALRAVAALTYALPDVPTT